MRILTVVIQKVSFLIFMDTCKIHGLFIERYILRELKEISSCSLIVFRNATPKPEHFLIDTEDNEVTVSQ